ncbi:hypothetical protein ACXEHV_002663 [Klebsiella quasipneumoniae]|nr:hypothetical protein [Klebsiella quasipneumoniae]MCQ3894981.1 hypothetical protein [Klebsiella quasipneumoniae]MEC5639038.1 hypothetical protein [Klebsiella quasipneumoniae]UKK45324.1 hypothetical protein HUZ48_19655 [Klebsiella quasipneumoniae]HBR1844714.1 hypothetical protein [Klebsiella quasipneumoniae subsp. quasipneumoniae]HCB1266619.1 hypothetical protein [Klebsiella quasipneumoniae subsp. quasipneumoniae]
MSAAMRRQPVARSSALRKNGAGCTLSARDLVQRLCFFRGGTV